MKFHKVLAKYYHKWFRDCHDSAVYCKEKGDLVEAEKYLRDAERYLNVILDNFEAIEFFSIGSNAYLSEESLPPEFRGY